MADDPKIGVVTVTYNSAQVIDGFMISLLGQRYTSFQAYIVDNASADLTLQRLAEYSDARVNVIRNSENLGVAEGNNQGICRALAAGCDSVLLINNDTEFEADLFEKLFAGLLELDCEMITPKILYFDNPELIWSAGGGFNVLKGYMGVHYGLRQQDGQGFDLPCQVDHAPTCCLLVRRTVFERVGLMDHRYFVYLDDTDFCFRAMRKGVKLFYLPSARVLHKVSSLTGGSESKFTARYCTRNHTYYMLKNLGLWRSLFYLPAFQMSLLAKLVLRKIDMSGFLIRERALLEGLRTWKLSATSSLATRERKPR